MPTFSPQKPQYNGQAPFVTVDLELSASQLTRPMMLEDIRQALLNDGFFVIENFTDHGVDTRTTTRLSSLLSHLFNLPESAKRIVDIAQSPNFRGYHSYSTATRHPSALDEEFVVGSDSPSPSRFDDDEDDLSESQTLGGTPVYQWLRGPNQWPSSRSLPGFKHSVEHFMTSMAELSNTLISEFVPEAIGGDSCLFENAFDHPTPQYQLRMIKQAASNSQEPNSLNPFSFKNKLAFASFLVTSKKDSSSLQIVGSDGRVTILPPNPDSIVVVFGEAMEHLTRGLCKSASYSLVAGPTTSYLTSFTQSLSVDFTYKNFVFPRALLAKAPQPECEIYCDEETKKETSFEFFDDYGMSCFARFMHQYPSTTKRWYSHLTSSATITVLDNLPRKFLHLVQLHKSIDNSILLHTISSTAPITFNVLCKRVSQDSRLTLEMAYLQQILTIWPESYMLSPSVVNKMEITISIPPSLEKKVTLIQSLPARQAMFERRCFKFAQQTNSVNISLHPIAALATPQQRHALTPAQTSRGALMRKTSREQASPYSLDRKSKPLTGASPSKLNRAGLVQPVVAKKQGSVLDRIRAKEAAAKEAKKFEESPEARHRKYLESKLPSIATVIAGLRKPSRQGQGETLALEHVLSKVRDSVKITISPKETEGALRLLAQKLPEFCTIKTVGKVTGVCIHNDLSISTILNRLTTVTA